MMTRLLLGSTTCILLVAVSAAVGIADATPAPRRVAVEDLYLFDRPSGVALTRDGKRAAYSRVWVDPKTKRTRHSLWVAEGGRDKAKPLEKGEPDARSPVFSPNGDWIAFLSTRARPSGWKQTPQVPPYSDPATDIWLIPAAGGQAVPLAGPDKPYGRVFGKNFYGRLAFSPVGSRLVFIADDGKDPRTPQEVAANVTIVRPDQGEGYTGYGAAQLWVAHLEHDLEDRASLIVERLTDDDVWYGDPQWSPDGRTIVVHANRTDDREAVRYSINKNYDLWSVDATSRALRQLTSGPGPEVSPRFSPEGKRLVCLSGPRKGPHKDILNLAVVSPEVTKPQMRIVWDHHAPGLDPFARPGPSFPLPENCWEDNRHVVYSAAVGTESATIQVDIETGAVIPLVKGESRFLQRGERQGALIPKGQRFLEERLIAESRLVRWKSDGLDLDGILTVPPPSTAAAPYSLVVYPHGGPHGRNTLGFSFKAQVFAAQGYAVFQPNFRGSHGYGREFLDADRRDFGGGDMRDVLSGVEFLVESGLADAEKQYVYGSSYGGFMTTWLVGHTQQFRAAVAQNAVTELNVMWGVGDIQSWTEWEFGGRPWEVPDLMRKHSPMSYVGNVATPTLILHARDDRRVPLPMGRMFYQSLLARGVPCQMVIYPDEGHAIRDPRHRVDILKRTLAWFAKYAPEK